VRVTGRSILLAVGAVLLSQPAATAQGNSLLQRIEREAAAQFRHEVHQYRDRLRRINYPPRPDAKTEKNLHDRIVRDHDSHLRAMARLRGENRARAERVRAPSQARNRTIRVIDAAYSDEVAALGTHEEEALRRLRESERR
jgi:hypothetical protein